MTEITSELIVDLSLKNLAHEKKIRELEIRLGGLLEELKNYQDYIREIEKTIGYSGHPGNIAGMLRERLKEGVVHEG